MEKTRFTGTTCSHDSDRKDRVLRLLTVPVLLAENLKNLFRTAYIAYIYLGNKQGKKSPVLLYMYLFKRLPTCAFL